MSLSANIKGLSKIALILLIIVSAVIGGIISYAFTIAHYIRIPEKTTLAITNIYINPENVESFNISVLNPSYSPTDATISKIAISLKDGVQLYDVVETYPSIKNGLKIQKGESINITCIKIKENNNTSITFGEFVSLFPGEKILVHVFAADSAAANMEALLPNVRLEIAAEFNSRISFKKFNITLTNSPQSEVNLTITDIVPGSITFDNVHPDFRSNPVMISRNSSRCFQFNGSWHGYRQIKLDVHTKQGYIFHKEVEMGIVRAVIKDVCFNENQTNQFNVTVYNYAESSSAVNVKKIGCILENGTELMFDCGSVELSPNTTKEFTFSWNWREYRGKNVTVVAYFTQDFETSGNVTVTPPPIIVKVLDAANTFSLKDKEHFNITLLNHASSLEAVNITKIAVEKTEDTFPVADGVISPGEKKTFKCAFNWTLFLNSYGRNLTLVVYATANQTLQEYTFNFSFILPVAELNVTVVNCITIGGTKYLNLTVKNSGYSMWNLTLSKIVIVVQDLAAPLEYVLPQKHVTVSVGGETVLLCPFDWQKYLGKSITVTAITDEFMEVSITFTIT
ncbi:hypothetical protein KEJ24_06575 [Candidatus Bathyarchaeota archaeon]|nr:hypothetical protein [Candidatus Bathyarchaeota archaeon]